MELVQDTSSSFAQSLLEELTLRSGLETASLSMFGAHSPFDHVTGLIDRTDTVDVGVRQLVVLGRVGKAHQVVCGLEKDAAARGAILRDGVAEAFLQVESR
jgi:hypothetical protein